MQSRPLILIWAFDHMLLALFTMGRCLPYEMISSALWSLELDGKFFGCLLRPMVDFVLRPISPDHCKSSYEWQKSLYDARKMT